MHSNHSRVGRRGPLCAAALVALLSLWLFAQPAGAAEYNVWSCRGPNAAFIGTSAWNLQPANASGVASDTCGDGGSIDVGLDAAPAGGYVLGDSSVASFVAPSGTKIEGYTLWSYFEVNAPVPNGDPVAQADFLPSTYTAGIRERDSGNKDEDWGDCVLKSDHCASGVQDQPPPDLNEINVSSIHGALLKQVQLRASCDSLFCTTTDQRAAVVKMFASVVNLQDNNAPTQPELSGSFTEAHDLYGMAHVNARSEDIGGGIKSMSLKIDGNVKQVQTTCTEPYTNAAPCSPTVTKDFPVDANTLGAGPHTYEVAVTDAAGNTTTSGERTAVIIDPPSGGGPGGGGDPTGPIGPPPPPPGPPVISFAELAYAANTADPVYVTGHLTRANGDPIADAELPITTRAIAVYGAQPVPLMTVTTEPDGRFVIPIRPNGALRVEASFSPRPSGPPVAVGGTTVQQKLLLSAKRSKAHIRSGRSFKLIGALTGAGDARAGVPVEIDTMIGRRWRSVGVVDTRADGSFTWKYRFTRVKHRTKFKFRAVVRKVPSWPWPTQISPTSKVTVG